jgi:MerR family transcriptional regulator/heat shock protein HspR
MTHVRRTRIEITQDPQRGVYMISVAADMAGMHPQTLRAYESKGLIEPGRSAKGTRLYSQADVERLLRIQEMTVELGLNLAGVAQVLALEDRLEKARAKTEAMETRAHELEVEGARLEALRRELRAEIVPWQAGGLPARRVDVEPIKPERISVERAQSNQ